MNSLEQNTKNDKSLTRIIQKPALNLKFCYFKCDNIEAIYIKNTSIDTKNKHAFPIFKVPLNIKSVFSLHVMEYEESMETSTSNPAW